MIDIQSQAKAYSEFLKNRRGPGPVPVFPVGKRGRGSSTEARAALARALARALASPYGRASFSTLTEWLPTVEGRLGATGFEFRTVDPSDYQYTRRDARAAVKAAYDE